MADPAAAARPAGAALSAEIVDLGWQRALDTNQDGVDAGPRAVESQMATLAEKLAAGDAAGARPALRQLITDATELLQYVAALAAVQDLARYARAAIPEPRP